MQEFPQRGGSGRRPFRLRRNPRAPPVAAAPGAAGPAARSLPPCSSLPGAGSLPPAPPPRTLLPHRRKPLRSLFPRGHPALPAHFCRTAGLRPAGQTVLRTVLGGARRRRPCGPPSPCRLPGTPTPKRPPERRALLSVSIPPSARPPAPPRSSSRCPPASPAAAPSGRAKTPPYPSRRCGSARIPSGSRCKAATHCVE